MNEHEHSLSGSDNLKAYTFFALISYARKDKKWSRWLKRYLQRYRLPAETHRKHPDLKRHCSPVFLGKPRPAKRGSSSSDEVQTSRYLIVICSRAAKADSEYMDSVIIRFLENGGDVSRVIPFIVDKSQHPVEECFPDYLAKLCETQNIVGVSVHDDSKRTALLRIIAAMHGIKREELESDDLRRLKKLRIAAFMLALAVCGASWFSWAYFVPKTTYYLDYTEVYGVPRGIRKLSRKEINSMSAHYVLVSCRFKVRELRYENSVGTPLMQQQLNHLEHFSRATYTYNDNDLATVCLYDHHGNQLFEMHYVTPNTIDLLRSVESADGQSTRYAAPLSSDINALLPNEPFIERRSNVIRYFVTYNKKGYATEVLYFSDSYNRIGYTDGVCGIRYVRDAVGRLVGKFYLAYSWKGGTNANHYTPTTSSSGEAGIGFIYNADGDNIETLFLNEQGDTYLNSSFGGIVRSEYVDHNEVRQTYYSTDKQLFTGSSGYAGWDAVYDGFGNIVKRSFFDTDGEPALVNEGYTGWESVFDEFGYETRRNFFGLNGEPVLVAEGYAGWESAFDELGYETRRSFFGLNGEPVLVAEGYTGWESTFNGLGYETRRSFFGLNGEPVLVAEGYAGWESVFDELGNRRKIGCFGINGEPVLMNEGFTGWESDFNELGNEIRRSFFGLNGEPVLHQDGNAGWEAVFDEFGNETKRSFFGLNGEPVLIGYGYAAWEKDFNEFGKAIKTSYFGTNGEPVLFLDCYSSVEQIYSRTVLVNSHYYDVNGKLIKAMERYRCIVVTDDDADAVLKLLQETCFLVKMGDWELLHCQQDDINLFSSLMEVIMQSADVPAEAWYLKFNADENRFKLFSTAYQLEGADLNLEERRLSAAEYEIIADAIMQSMGRVNPYRDIS